MLFPSQEWAERFVAELNDNEEYFQVAETWEGSFLFIVNAGPRLESKFILFLDLWHGKCREFSVLPNRDVRRSDYIYEGSIEHWEKLVKGELDPIKGIFARKFKIKGRMLKILRNVRAASELAKNCSRVPTEFPK